MILWEGWVAGGGVIVPIIWLQLYSAGKFPVLFRNTQTRLVATYVCLVISGKWYDSCTGCRVFGRCSTMNTHGTIHVPFSFNVSTQESVVHK